MTQDALVAEIADTLRLQRLVLDFAARDRGDWPLLQSLFAPGAVFHVSWYHGAIEGFVAASRAMAERGAPASKHLIATPRIDVAGAHAVGETDVVIMIRLPIDGGEVDVASWARFHDLFERRDGRWSIVRRVAIYEKDRVDPVGATKLDESWSPAALAHFPAAYKHLAKMLELVGRSVVAGSPVTGSAEAQAIDQEARDWLAQGRAG